MQILQINSYDVIGGAAKVANHLHHFLQKEGVISDLAVGRKISLDPEIIQIPVRENQLIGSVSRKIYSLPKFFGRNFLTNFLYEASLPISSVICKTLGIEDFEFPSTKNIYKILPALPDIIHAHNLHGDYFDLRELPNLSTQLPFVVTLHDAWLLSGHCAHSFDCERWKSGCGSCPYLGTNPPIKHDFSAYNWRRKRKIFEKSIIYAVTPSKWLMNKVDDSILNIAIRKSKVIHNGIDLSIFHPENKFEVRRDLNLRQEDFICLFVANGIRENMFKDVNTIISALQIISKKTTNNNIKFIALGGDVKDLKLENTEIISIPYISDPFQVAKYYQASDVYLHASKADTYPNVILEAQACGIPVVATNIGGIPEQIWDGETGFITPAADPILMAERVIELLESEVIRNQIGFNAAQKAKNEFSMELMTHKYISFYEEVLEDWQMRK